MTLEKSVHTALDEVRMQMLGAQVLFGFQLQGVFQEGFPEASNAAHLSDLTGFALIIVTLALLIAGPAQHRLVEKGMATRRIVRIANRFAEAALVTFAIAVGFDIYAVTERYLGTSWACAVAIGASLTALALWFPLGWVLRATLPRKENAMPQKGHSELHEKIDQMLTESRVILPGAQAVFGFQFVVTMTKAFAELPHDVQMMHFAALGMIGLAIMLLLAPAAVHRLTFGGEDDERMHDIGSFLVTIALVPLAFGISGDVFVAVFKILGGQAAAIAAAAAIALLLALWYALPFAIRARRELRT
jgi:hypothetical protein